MLWHFYASRWSACTNNRIALRQATCALGEWLGWSFSCPSKRESTIFKCATHAFLAPPLERQNRSIHLSPAILGCEPERR